jgi:hypothetical protein
MSTVKNHSSYWLDDDIFNDDPDTPTPIGIDMNRIIRLAAVRRAVANFVSILSGKNIPVRYSSGKQSYTDGQSVVIAAEEDPAKFDSLVGLALHEGSHILLTDFKFIAAVQRLRNCIERHFMPNAWTTVDMPPMSSQNDNVLNHLLPDGLKYRGKLPDAGEASYEVWNNLPYWNLTERMLGDIHTIMNILEDRRIDQYVYRNAQGYRPYYDALYAKYFLTTEMEKNLRFNPEWRELTIENYINRLLFAIHPASDPDALPGLRALINRMNLATIDRVGPEHDPKENGKAIFTLRVPTFTECPILWQEACTLYMHILQYVQLTPNPSNSDKELVDAFDQTALNGLPNLDGNPQTPSDMQPTEVERNTKGRGKNIQSVPGKYNPNKAKTDLEKIRQFMSETTKKKAAKKVEQEAIAALETANADMVDLKGDGIAGGRCMVLRKITDSLLTQPWYIFSKSWWDGDGMEAAIRAGNRMGAILHHRLQVRNDPVLTKQTRLPQGGLDRRLLAQLGMDITSVFQTSRIDQHRPVLLHLTLDASGSMSGKKWSKVVTVATAIAYISAKLQNVDAVISLRGGADIPLVSIIYDSRINHLQHYYRYIRQIGPSGSTPEGLAFKATMQLILENTTTHDVYLVNFSDGEPSFGFMNNGYYVQYHGETATTHTRTMVRRLREHGVKILSYFIQDSRSGWTASPVARKAFTKMYEQDAEFVNVENAGDVLRTLNKLLLVRGT